MTKREELADPNSCFNKAKDDELIFVLLERDEAACHAVLEWAKKRVELGKNLDTDPKIVSAVSWVRAAELLRDFPSTAGSRSEEHPTAKNLPWTAFRDYTNAVARYGPDSAEAAKVRALYAGDEEFDAYAAAADRLKRELGGCGVQEGHRP